MVEISVGVTFIHNGKKVKCKEGRMEDCIRCAFFERAEDDEDTECWDYHCTPGGRKDGKTVYFEEVENG